MGFTPRPFRSPRGFQFPCRCALERSRKEIRETLRDGEVKCLLLHTHAVHYLKGHFKTWLAAKRIGDAFAPGLEIKAVINLIDNVFANSARTMAKGWPLTLPQLFLWRDIEQTMSEVVATQFSRPRKSRMCTDFYVFAIRHPTKTLTKLVHGLIADRSEPRIYMSYSISDTRNRLQAGRGDRDRASELLNQNRHFREHFAEALIAFDPGTIDERPLFAKAAAGDGISVEIDGRDLLAGGDLWPLGFPDDMLCNYKFDSLKFKASHVLGALEALTLDTAEVVPGETEVAGQLIDRYITSRDYDLIDQSHAVIAFRPTVWGQWSVGVRAELEFAKGKGRPVLVIKDPADPPPNVKGAFSPRLDPVEIVEKEVGDAKKRVAAFEEGVTKLRAAIAHTYR